MRRQVGQSIGGSIAAGACLALLLWPGHVIADPPATEEVLKSVSEADRQHERIDLRYARALGRVGEAKVLAVSFCDFSRDGARMVMRRQEVVNRDGFDQAELLPPAHRDAGSEAWWAQVKEKAAGGALTIETYDGRRQRSFYRDPRAGPERWVGTVQVAAFPAVYSPLILRGAFGGYDTPLVSELLRASDCRVLGARLGVRTYACPRGPEDWQLVEIDLTRRLPVGGAFVHGSFASIEKTYGNSGTNTELGREGQTNFCHVMSWIDGMPDLLPIPGEVYQEWGGYVTPRGGVLKTSWERYHVISISRRTGPLEVEELPSELRGKQTVITDLLLGTQVMIRADGNREEFPKKQRVDGKAEPPPPGSMGGSTGMGGSAGRILRWGLVGLIAGAMLIALAIRLTRGRMATAFGSHGP